MLLISELKNDLRFNNFLKHLCPSTNAEHLAETLILGKKIVRDGEYALLDNSNNKQYYIRKNSRWTKVNNIKDESFLDNNVIFCNINKKCIKNDRTQTCDFFLGYVPLFLMPIP